jgi:hypothetical protein
VSAHVVFLAASAEAGQSSPRPRIAACLVAALASWSRGGRVVAPEQAAVEQVVDIS